MFIKAARQGVFILLLIGSRQVVAAQDSIYTHPIHTPDFLAGKVSAPLDKPKTGLSLVGWESGLVPFDSSDSALGDREPPVLHLTVRQARETLQRFAGMLKLNVRFLDTWTDVDGASGKISFHYEHDATQLTLPVTVSKEWYVPNKLAHELKSLRRAKLAGSLQPRTMGVKSQRTIELIGADIGGQRVSLQVAGNVSIKGGVRFQNQEKSNTNFRSGKRWDLEVDQTQRFDITGSIGDRIDVIIHQDSENDFEWENDMKIAYTGQEDEILQKVDAGNISLSLPGTQFATGGGGGSKGLFGIKALSQLGPVDLMTIASIERSKKSTKSNTLTEALVIQDRLFMKNRYFFIDMEFRSNYYPLNEDDIHTFNLNRVIKQLEVYRASSRISQVRLADTYNGVAFVDPKNPAAFPDSVVGQFERLELNVDYVPNYQLGYIRLQSPSMDDDIIAVAYTLGSATGDAVFDSVGTINFLASDSLSRIRLKLIKDRGQSANSPTWPLEFKNVYSLGAININPEGFEVKIYDRQGTSRSDRFPDGETFLKKFGLDRRQNESQQGAPDDIIDSFNGNLVNLNLGELHFPSLLPFAYSRVPGLATRDSALFEIYGYELEDSGGDFPGDFQFDEQTEDLDSNGVWDVPDIYYAPTKPIQPRFEIEIHQSSKGASTYNLGFNMVPGSEVVKINGIELQKGDDYQIDTFSNTLTILNMEKYVNPEVTIEYEENSLVSFDKKVMMGTRAQIDLGENSFLGLTGLFYNQSIIDERVDVGSEPIRNLLWDVNGRFGREVPLLTRLIDRLPFIETDEPSRFNIEGEIAQVLPNPNPLGAGYVDDFEAAKRVTSPTLLYRAWQQSSAPKGKRLRDRRKIAWWNPYVDRDVREIWPEREISTQAGNVTTKILILDAFFERYSETVTDSMWAGITYPLFPSDYDQSQTKFFEIWLNGKVGRIHIDIGAISEDINGNGKIDTEDDPLLGTTEGNGILEPHEDVGLDGCLDEFEDGTGGCFGIDDDGDGQIDEGIYDPSNSTADGIDLAVWPVGVDINDPNGDNWSNTQSNSSNDFVNGTQGNGATTDGTRPDTEDLNGTGSFAPDVRNDYFAASFQLDPFHPEFDSSLVGGRTFFDNGNPTGWRLFRIPLADFIPDGSGTVVWEQVQNLRIWMDGLGDAGTAGGRTGRVQIAQIEFVGNEWKEIGIADKNSNKFTLSDSSLNMAVTVVNTEDNDEYTSPPGIQGVFDRINNIRLKEQSLALDFRKIGLPPNQQAAVTKNIVHRSNESTFLAYRTMEMFLHGESETARLLNADTLFIFWLRLGLGKDVGESYYEIRKPLYAGWDKRNHLYIDMEKLARLKLDEEESEKAPSIVVDADTLQGYFLGDMLVYIKGDPSVERIGRYTVGVINEHPSDTIKGRVFMDELRLTNVKRENGMAIRLSGSLKLADLVTSSFNYSRRDAEFHTVRQKILRNPATTEKFQTSLLINPDRLLPQSWGVRIPVSLNYSRSLTSPKYIPGRDIIAGDLNSAPEEIQSRNEQIAMKVSFNKSVRSRYFIVRQTLDRLQGGITYQLQEQSNKEIKRLEKQSIASNLSYPIKFSDENYIRPFKIISKLPWIGNKLKDTRVYYTPSSVQFGGTLTEVLSFQDNRTGVDTTIERYNFNLKRSVSAKYRLTDKMNFDYARNANNSLDQFRYTKIASLMEQNPGLNLQFNEQYSSNFDPEIFSWLKPKFTYQSQYQWTKNRPVTDPLRGGKIGVSSRFSSKVSLTPKEIIETIYNPRKKRSSPSSRRSRRGNRRQQPTTQDTIKIKSERMQSILKALHSGASKILPITFNYSLNTRRSEPYVRGQPGYAYRLGLEETSNLTPDDSSTGGLDLSQTAKNKDISWKSGLSLTKKVNLDMSLNRKRSVTRNSSSVTRSFSETFLLLSDDGDFGIPLVNWSIRWSGLEKLPLLKLIPWTVSAEHSYTGNHVQNVQNTQAPVNTYNRSFQPLLGLNMSFKNGISANLRYSDQLSLDIKDSGDTKMLGNQISASFSYQHRGGFTIPLPFFRDFKLSNTINISLGVESSESVQKLRKGSSPEFVRYKRDRTLSLKPYITYTFSDKVTGSFRFTYTERESDITGLTVTRNVGFDVNIAIRGS